MNTMELSNNMTKAALMISTLAMNVECKLNRKNNMKRLLSES